MKLWLLAGMLGVAHQETQPNMDLTVWWIWSWDKSLISDLVTERHSQIKAYMKKERTDINHWFDVWHVAKGNSVYVI